MYYLNIGLQKVKFWIAGSKVQVVPVIAMKAYRGKQYSFTNS
jgi:hypothetical protein